MIHFLSRGNPALPRVLRMPNVLTCCLIGGCAGTSRLESPPWETQRAAIAELAPPGTPRDEVAERLKEAGVSFSPSGAETEYRPGSNASTFYCAVWHRPDGSIWPLDVELWFDEQGKLADVQRDSQTAARVDEPAPATSSLTDETVEPSAAVPTDSIASPRTGQFRPFNSAPVP